jgi:trehalose 6-phosphate phosphatase
MARFPTTAYCVGEMLVNAMTELDRWLDARRRTGCMMLGLDFDGTLAPIALRPGEAAMLPETRKALDSVAARGDTMIAIVSGRGLEDVTAKVGIPALYYVGNHGLEIRGPNIELRHEEAVEAEPAIRECAERVADDLAGTPGVIVEDKGLTFSVHYRLVKSAAAEEAVRDRVWRSCGENGMRITEGRKVLEIRPNVDWNKGNALLFLIDMLIAIPEAPVLFVGDDLTDEDGFRAVVGRGNGIVVGDPPPPSTAARYYLPTPEDVTLLLRRLG